jgi:CDP-glucose 4,6-dehydratase
VKLHSLSAIKALQGPILITGHTGFKGAWLSLLLHRLGVATAGISLPAEKYSLCTRLDESVADQEYFLDIRNREKLNEIIQEIRPSAIFHLAAQPLVLDSYKDPVGTFETNVIGTAHLLDAAFKVESVKSVICATTDKVYRNDERGNSFKENDPLAGKDPYSASKVGSESAISAWQQISQVNNGPKVMAVRAGNVIGGGDFANNRLLPDLIRSVQSGTKTEIRNPESTRPWQHVLDPLIGYVLLLEASLQADVPKAFNFAPAENSLNVKEVVKIAQSAWPEKIQYEIVKENSEMESEKLQLNANLANDYLNWAPVWSQENSIISTINWWKKVILNEQSALIACMEDIEILGESYDFFK